MNKTRFVNPFSLLRIFWFRFSFDGTRINEGDTPKSLDMEDGDTIEVCRVAKMHNIYYFYRFVGFLDRKIRHKKVKVDQRF